jgi:hypothetical protein
MAIQTLIVGERGERYENSYCRIERVLATREQLHIQYGMYLTEEDARNGNPPPLIFDIYGDYNIIDDRNTWQQAYDIIKRRHPDSVDV